MLFAVIPAAGKSSRMGRPKLALPLGEFTIVEWVIRALFQGGAQEVLVVLGPHLSQLLPEVQRAGASALLLSEETPDMRATVELGLQHLEDHFHPDPEDDWLLVPADHPTLAPAVIRQLVQARQTHPDRTISLPTYQGKRGHPALLRWRHVPEIRRHPSDLGLNTYLRQHLHETQEVPVDSPDILLDLDTPEDYEQLQRRWPFRAV